MNNFKNRNTIVALMMIYILSGARLGWAQNSAGNKSESSQMQPTQTGSKETTATTTVPVNMDELNPQIKQAIAEQNQTNQANSVIANIDSMPSDSKYTLGENDVIEVTVLRHPELSGQFAINNEGKIQYEFVGDIKISGLTKKETTEELTKLLSKYIISPDINVKIIGYNSKVVYVIGEVGSPGKIFMRGDTITVREALMQSGLPLLSANTPKGSLITPSTSGKAVQKNVNIHKLLIEGDLRENLVMKPGDTLYVPPTLMAKAMRVIQPVAAPIGTAAGTARTVYTGGL